MMRAVQAGISAAAGAPEDAIRPTRIHLNTEYIGIVDHAGMDRLPCSAAILRFATADASCRHKGSGCPRDRTPAKRLAAAPGLPGGNQLPVRAAVARQINAGVRARRDHIGIRRRKRQETRRRCLSSRAARSMIRRRPWSGRRRRFAHCFPPSPHTRRRRSGDRFRVREARLPIAPGTECCSRKRRRYPTQTVSPCGSPRARNPLRPGTIRMISARRHRAPWNAMTRAPGRHCRSFNRERLVSHGHLRASWQIGTRCLYLTLGKAFSTSHVAGVAEGFVLADTTYFKCQGIVPRSGLRW